MRSAWSIIDDNLMTKKMIKECLEILEAVLTWLEEAGLQLKWDRCAFLLSTEKYLGYKIMAQGLQPTVDEVKAVQNAPVPQDVSQLKLIIGLISYYGKILPDLSSALAPFYRLLQEKLFTCECLFSHYDSNKELILAHDASPYELGTVLFN